MHNRRGDWYLLKMTKMTTVSVSKTSYFVWHASRSVNYYFNVPQSSITNLVQYTVYCSLNRVSNINLNYNVIHYNIICKSQLFIIDKVLIYIYIYYIRLLYVYFITDSRWTVNVSEFGDVILYLDVHYMGTYNSVSRFLKVFVYF